MTITWALPSVVMVPLAVMVSTCATVSRKPAVVFAETAACVIPEPMVGLVMAMFKLASLATASLRVRMTDGPASLTLKSEDTSGSAARVARTLAATTASVCPTVTGTHKFLGEPVMPLAVTTTIALPLAVTAPATVAVSIWATGVAAGVTVLADVGAATTPTEPPLLKAMFKVVSFAS